MNGAALDTTPLARGVAGLGMGMEPTRPRLRVRFWVRVPDDRAGELWRFVVVSESGWAWNPATGTWVESLAFVDVEPLQGVGGSLRVATVDGVVDPGGPLWGVLVDGVGTAVQAWPVGGMPQSVSLPIGF